MNHLRIRFCSIAVVMSLSRTWTAAAPNPPPLELILLPSDEAFRLGGAASFDVLLKNTSDAPLLVLDALPWGVEINILQGGRFERVSSQRRRCPEPPTELRRLVTLQPGRAIFGVLSPPLEALGVTAPGPHRFVASYWCDITLAGVTPQIADRSLPLTSIPVLIDVSEH